MALDTYKLVTIYISTLLLIKLNALLKALIVKIIITTPRTATRSNTEDCL